MLCELRSSRCGVQRCAAWDELAFRAAHQCEIFRGSLIDTLPNTTAGHMRPRRCHFTKETRSVAQTWRRATISKKVNQTSPLL